MQVDNNGNNENNDMRVDQDDKNIDVILYELVETEVVKEFVQEIKLDIQN